MGKGMRRRVPLSLGGPSLLIAIDDDVFDESARDMTAQLSAALDGDVSVVAVRASEFSDPANEADLYVGRYRPTTPDCQVALDFMSAGTVVQFEQDERTGAVYRGKKLVWPSAPIAATRVPNEDRESSRPSDWALYFADGRRIRITTIPDVLNVHRPFRTRALAEGEWLDPNWVKTARQALSSPATKKS